MNDLTPDIASIFEAARRAHPNVAVSANAFSAACARRQLDSEKAMTHAGDLLLAAGLELKDRAALEWLMSEVQRLCQLLDGRVPKNVREEVASAVVDMVLGTSGLPAKIANWQARGPLSGWLQVIVVRQAQARWKNEGARRTDEDIERAVLQDLQQPGPSLELQALKARFQGALGPSLRAAAEKLSSKERALIAMHYVDGVSLDGLARAYQVHRATVARWLSVAREAFLEGTRDALAERTHLPRLEVDSVVRALQSQVDISLRQLLRE